MKNDVTAQSGPPNAHAPANPPDRVARRLLEWGTTWQIEIVDALRHEVTNRSAEVPFYAVLSLGMGTFLCAVAGVTYGRGARDVMSRRLQDAYNELSHALATLILDQGREPEFALGLEREMSMLEQELWPH
jgi:hypothetical protein